MAVKVLVIAGTLAPPQSEFYYRPLLNVAGEVVDYNNVSFETISNLGLGDIKKSTAKIAKKHLYDSDDQWLIIGHSQGGIIATLLAIEYSAKVTATILIASPLAGTTWTDPINMPVRYSVEFIAWLTKGRVRLRPKLRRMLVPIPIVRDLAAHSDISEFNLAYLKNQVSGHHTYSIVGLADWLVFPHRSAHPEGRFVHNFLIAPRSEYDLVKDKLPDNIEHVCTKVGHLFIIHNPEVLELIKSIILKHINITQAA